MTAFLRHLGGSGSSDRFDIPIDRKILIGRGEGCDLRIDDPSLSRVHCSIEFESSRWRVADCKSINGTRVGGFRVSETLISPGEELQIGNVRLEFHVVEAADQTRLANQSRIRCPLAGRHFGRFELLRRVHVGSSGTVYLAREADKNREVALKLLAPGATIDEAARNRFERGVQTLASLQHSGIVQPYSIGRTDRQAWLSMEWVEGPSLRDVLDRQPSLSPAEAIRIIRATTGAVAEAAQRGIVHGHLKPSSILLGPGGEPKLGDFVLAGTVARSSADPSASDSSLRDAEYLAPECFQESSDVDSRADVYSLGACLYSILVGRPPFRESSVSRLMHRVLHDPAPPARQLELRIPEEVESIIGKCLAKDPGARFQSPQELFAALVELGELAPTPVTRQQTAPADFASRDAVHRASPESSNFGVGDEPVSLPSSVTPTSGTWRRFLIIPKPTNAPAERPWMTLLVTVAIVVGLGSLLLFKDRFNIAPRGNPGESNKVKDDSDQLAPRDSNKSIAKPVDTKPVDAKPVESAGPPKQPEAAMADPERLVVQPGTPLRTISGALEVAKDGQIIEVASNDSVRGEIKLPAKSITLVASSDFHPVFRNTVRINGGGTIRMEGFHFEPYLPNKPAIEVEKMPEKLQLVMCTFRNADGVLIAIDSTTGASVKRPQFVLERSFAVGNIMLGLAGIPPDLRIHHTCLVIDQSVIDWQLSPDNANAPGAWDMQLRHNTIVSRSMYHVTLDDQRRPISQLPQTTIRLDDNIFAFPSRYPCTFFRWEAWQRPDIVQSRFAWSGNTNAFSGTGTWSMATTLALSDPAATPQIAMESPDDWQRLWADQVDNILKLPAEFRYVGPPKKIRDVSPTDYELIAQSKLRELGTDKRSLGADIRTLPVPPEVR